MRPILPVALLLAGCGGAQMPAGTQVAASGADGTRSFDARGFTGIINKGPDDVEVRTGSDFSVRASGDAALLDRLDVRLDGPDLAIGRTGTSWNSGKLRILVTMPAVARGSVAGSGDLLLDRAGGSFAGSVGGSGDLAVGQIAGRQAVLSVAGSGSIAAAGNVDRLQASISGSGDIAAPGLRARTAQAAIVGSGSLRAEVLDAARVSMVGSGDVDLGPDARCTVSRAGSGTVRCRR